MKAPHQRLLGSTSRRLLSVAALVAVVALGACPMVPVHVDTLAIGYPQPLVAKRDPTPLVIVATNEDVPDHFRTPPDPVKPIDVHGVRAFVSRDVKRALETFYESVTVVSSEGELPTTPHVAARVRITKITTQADMATDGYGQTAVRVYGVMDWAIALRRSDQDEYFFSYASRAVGTAPLVDVSQTAMMFEATFEVALTAFIEAYVERDR